MITRPSLARWASDRVRVRPIGAALKPRGGDFIARRRWPTMSFAPLPEFTVLDDANSTTAAIPPERIPHLFEGLSQFADERARQGGIGLGLFICREIVRAHGGEITVASSDGEGTSFVVRLPLDASELP